MTGWSNGEEEENIWYHDSSLEYRVKSIRNSENSYIYTYRYAIDPSDSLHSTVETRVIDGNGQEYSLMREQFYEKVTPPGSRWLARHETEWEGTRKISEYAMPGLPLTMESGESKALFQYDGQGRLTRKVDGSGVVTELAYDGRSGKISQAAKYATASPDEKVITSFRYDDSGNLLSAECNDGRRADLSYYPNNMISELIIANQRAKFEYNEFNKPVRILVEEIGEIRVSYNKDGSIDKTETLNGTPILGLTVTAMFQKLLDLVAEAKVSLTMY